MMDQAIKAAADDEEHTIESMQQALSSVLARTREGPRFARGHAGDTQAMKTVFLTTDPDGTQREVFAVHLRGGVLIVTGDAAAARSLGVPTDPIRFPVAADPRSDPERYLRTLAVAYGYGSMLRAVCTE